MGILDTLQGNVSAEDRATATSGVQGPTAIQIAGMPEYTQALQALQTQYGQGQPDMTGYAAQYGNAAQGAAGQFGNIGSQYGALGQGYGQQMAGLGQQQVGLYGQIPQGPNLQSVTADPMMQLKMLQAYQQQVAMGQAPSAADQMLQNQNAHLGGQLQSGIVSAGGMNPALALRQLFQNQSTASAQIGAAGAQQKLQEQGQFGQQAGQNAQALYGQNFENAQQGFQNQNQTYQNQMGNLAQQGQTAQAGLQGQGQALQGQQNAVNSQYNALMQATQHQQAAIQQQYMNRIQSLGAQQSIADSIYGAQAKQATFNQDFQDRQQAYQMWQAQQKLQAQQDAARAKAAAIHGAITGALTIGGAVAGSFAGNPMMGAMAGQTAAGLVPGPSGGGGGGGMDPYMMSLMMRQAPGGGSSNPGQSNLGAQSMPPPTAGSAGYAIPTGAGTSTGF